MGALRENPSALVLSYARKDNCLRIIEKLHDYKCKSLYLYLDGPKTPEIEHSQNLLLTELKKLGGVGGNPIKVKRSPLNNGIAVSMIKALDWFFSHEESGIILEDDLDFGVSFISFIKESLNRFINDEKVVIVSGNRYSRSLDSSSIAWCNYPQTWGWATWSRGWATLKKAYAQPISLSSFSVTSPARNFWAMGTNYVIRGTVDTWDIPLAFLMRQQELLTILPPNNLVANLGNDLFATHTNSNNFPIGFPYFEIDPSKIHYSNSDDFRSQSTKKENRYLEKYVFKIKKRHILLPIKFLLDQDYGQSLESRLTNAKSRDIL